MGAACDAWPAVPRDTGSMMVNEGARRRCGTAGSSPHPGSWWTELHHLPTWARQPREPLTTQYPRLVYCLVCL
jgi:hypothetical protein